MTKSIPRITDIAPVSAIEHLRFKPVQRAGSRHLMTSEELEATIAEVSRKVARGWPNAESSLALLLEERAKRESDTDDIRAARLRHRLAWEVAQERKEAKSPKYRSRDLPARYGEPPGNLAEG